MTTEIPEVAIIMPAYNRADVIGESIESVLAQTFPNFEIIVVDDWSTDETVAVVEGYQKRDSRIRLVKNEENLGAPRSRNKGLALTRAKYVNFLDSDDVLHPEKLERQFYIHKIEEGYDLVVCQALRFSSYVGEPNMAPYTHLTGPLTFLRFLGGHFNWATATPLWRREFVQEIGGFVEDLPCFQDWELNGRALIAEARIFAIEDPLAYYRSDWSAQQITGGGRAALKKKQHLALLSFVEFAKRHPTRFQEIRLGLSWSLVMSAVELMRAGQMGPAREVISVAFRTAPNFLRRMGLLRYFVKSMIPRPRILASRPRVHR